MKRLRNEDAPHVEELLDEALEESFPASDPAELTLPHEERGPARVARPASAKGPGKPHDEALLDEALDESFPASDPVAVSPAREVRKRPARATAARRRKH